MRYGLGALMLVAGMGLAAATGVPKKKPPAPQDDFKKALDLYNQGKAADARPLFQKVQKAAPARPDVYYYLGLCDAKTPDHAQAVVDFTKTISLDDKYMAAYFERAGSYTALQKYSDAANDLNRVVMAQPDNTQAWYNRGQVYAALKNDQEAVTSYLKVLEAKPGDGYTHYYIGLSYYNINQKDMAVEHFQTFVALMPTAPEAEYIKRLLQQLAGW